MSCYVLGGKDLGKNKTTIIIIDKLESNYNGYVLCYLGRNLQTGELGFYVNHTKQKTDEWNSFEELPHGAFRKLDENPYREPYYWEIKSHITYLLGNLCDYKHITDEVEKAISIHEKYNIENGLPTEILIKNRKNYVVSQLEQGVFSDYRLAATYNPYDNHLSLPLECLANKNMSNSEKEELGENVLHEAGHMDVSQMVYEGKKEVSFINGFCINKFEPEVFQTEDGNIFLNLLKFDLDSVYSISMLEETFVELKCSLINPSYKKVYPNFAPILNKITNGVLPKARYGENALDVFHLVLHEIIPSRDMSEELLEDINRARDDNSIKRAFKLLGEYEKVWEQKKRGTTNIIKPYIK